MTAADGDPVWITPEWPAPAELNVCTTTRIGGVSTGPWTGFNLADHVGDDPAAVAENRRQLQTALALPASPRWLQQVHGTRVLSSEDPGGDNQADGWLLSRPRDVCAVLTADCLPVVLCDRNGQQMAVVHAGWRGLAGGVVEAAATAMTAPPEQLLAWLGPAIGPAAFEVGGDVRAAFVAQDTAAADAFSAGRAADHWYADIYLLARQRLARLGITAIFGGQWCTLTDAERFFSYRRDGTTGRMATLVWMQS